ncbi:MAG: family 16 glycosylhydrolase [Pseudomonadota bacterium]
MAWSEGIFQEYPLDGSFISDLGSLVSPAWYVGDYSVSQHHHYNTAFSSDYVVRDGDVTSLKIDRNANPPNSTTGGEVQRTGSFSYGRYEVVMRPAKGSGLVSSFFTYSGPYFGTVHDEIDIEFLGNNTREVSLNIFTDGKPLVPAKKVELPFDASESFNLYAFEWSPQAVHWYVNEQRVFTVSASERKLPSTPGKVMANLWTGDEYFHSWHGPPHFEDGTTSDYKCMSYLALGDDAQQCSDVFFR